MFWCLSPITIIICPLRDFAMYARFSIYNSDVCEYREREGGHIQITYTYTCIIRLSLPTYCIYIYTPPHIIQTQKYSQCTTLPSRHHPRSCPVGHGRYRKRVRSSQVSCWFQVEQCSKPTSFRYTAWCIGISHSGLWYIVIIMNQQAFWTLLMSWRALNPPAFCALGPSAGVEIKEKTLG